MMIRYYRFFGCPRNLRDSPTLVCYTDWCDHESLLSHEIASTPEHEFDS
jgi:hypothetical protein